MLNKYRKRSHSTVANPNQFNVLSVVNIVKTYPDLLLNSIESLMIQNINFNLEFSKFLKLFQIAVSSPLKKIKFMNCVIPHVKREDFILCKPTFNKKRYLESISLIN